MAIYKNMVLLQKTDASFWQQNYGKNYAVWGQVIKLFQLELTHQT